MIGPKPKLGASTGNYSKSKFPGKPEKGTDMDINKVTVRWWDGYMEEFETTEVRFGCDLLFMRLVDGKNRQIPLRGVRWFGMSQESHQN